MPRECNFTGRVIPCVTSDGAWWGSHSAWCKAADVQPPFTDAVWGGRTDGSIAVCRRPTGTGLPDPGFAFHVWLPSATEPPPDPKVLARQLLARMQLKAIRIGTFPYSVQKAAQSLNYVGWNTWLWAENPDPSTYGPTTMSISEAGYTVTATAKVKDVVWDMGNGDTVTCDAGTPWPRSAVHNEASPDCGYKYTKQGEYQVSATSHWVIDWSGIGESGQLTLATTDSVNLRVAEVQVVNVDPQDG